MNPKAHGRRINNDNQSKIMIILKGSKKISYGGIRIVSSDNEGRVE
ncbi:MAG: hypothetical protein ACP5KW_11910 [Thermoproteota archaeon]